jgi:HSP20 family protein
MDIKQLAPWNWFKKENEQSRHTVPVKYSNKSSNRYSPESFGGLHNEMDRLLDDFFNGLAVLPFRPRSFMREGISGDLLKPSLDLGATEKEYTVSIEIPGVSEKDVSIELVHDSLIIRGEKKQRKEEKRKNFYRLERSYGSFQRTLSLPEDVNRENIKADFKNGVLNITIPRLAIPENKVKQIQIKHA